MKTYVATTGIVFALLVFSHVARLFVEGAWVLSEPIFLLTSIASIGMTLWAIVLLRKLLRSG